MKLFIFLLVFTIGFCSCTKAIEDRNFRSMIPAHNEVKDYWNIKGISYEKQFELSKTLVMEYDLNRTISWKNTYINQFNTFYEKYLNPDFIMNYDYDLVYFLNIQDYYNRQRGY